MDRHPHVVRARRNAGAPDGLRRRVIAGVRSRPAPLSELAHRMRRVGSVPLAARGWALVLLAVVAATLPIVLALAPGAGSSRQRGIVAAGVPGVRVALRAAGSRTEMALSGMPRVPARATYEVWLLRESTGLRPIADMFTVTSAGRAVVALPGNLHGVAEVTITREPLGGSVWPTGPTVLEILNPGALVEQT